LNRVTQQALRSYVPSGEPVSGGASPERAPGLGRGVYLDRLGPGQSKYYSVDVPAGHTAYVTASAVLPLRVHERVWIRRFASDGSSCGRSQDTKRNAEVVGAVHHTWDVEDDPGEARPCDAPGRYVLQVERDGQGNEAQAPDDSPLELLVGLEPPLSGDPGEQGVPEVTFTDPGGAPRPVVGGGSF
ncbi:hypothetical protein ACFQ07_07285, partial [Actinomadura adrarensis]